MKTTMRGIIRGRNIELPHETGLVAGQEVTVTVEPVTAPMSAGEGIRHSAGAWAEDITELDQYLEWNRQQRKRPRRGIDQ